MTKETSVKDVVLALHDNMLNLMENEAMDVKEYHEYTDKHIDQALAQIKELMPSEEEIEKLLLKNTCGAELLCKKLARYIHKLIEGRLK